MKNVNLSEWALRHRSLNWYFMLVCTIAGVMSYLSLGREEDPAFTIKTMLIQAQWPGASVEDTINQITERIERKLEELEALDYTKPSPPPARPRSGSTCATPPRRATCSRPGIRSAT